MWSFAKELARLTICGSKVLFNSVKSTVFEEIQLSNELAKMRKAQLQSSDVESKTGIGLQEAMRILNVDKLEKNIVDEQYKRLFDANEKSTGGSFYIQSKIVRAKERIYMEFAKNITSGEKLDLRK